MHQKQCTAHSGKKRPAASIWKNLVPCVFFLFWNLRNNKTQGQTYTASKTATCENWQTGTLVAAPNAARESKADTWRAWVNLSPGVTCGPQHGSQQLHRKKRTVSCTAHNFSSATLIFSSLPLYLVIHVDRLPRWNFRLGMLPRLLQNRSFLFLWRFHGGAAWHNYCIQRAISLQLFQLNDRYVPVSESRQIRRNMVRPER